MPQLLGLVLRHPRVIGLSGSPVGNTASAHAVPVEIVWATLTSTVSKSNGSNKLTFSILWECCQRRPEIAEDLESHSMIYKICPAKS